MESLHDFFELILNSKKLIHYGGLSLIVLIVFIETGLFFGFFLPGDYLLFTAGLLCGTQDLEVGIFTLLTSVTVAAIAGDYAGYASGKLAGDKLFQRDDSLLFKRSHLEKTKIFLKKYGPQSLIAGRFLPVIRTFAPILAGAAQVDLKKFTLYNISGAILWVWSLIPLGYFLGSRYPGIIDYIEYIIIAFILLTTSALVREVYKSKRMKLTPANNTVR